MDFVELLANFFKGGGIFMYPILLILSLGTAIIIEKMIYLLRSGANGNALWKEIRPFIISNKIDDAIKSCERSNVPLYKMLRTGLVSAKDTESREDIESSLEETLLEVLPKLERRTHYLPALANVATLLGLLGTIIGLIQAFQAISVAEPSQRAAILAQGVSVAMNTTAFGLIVAIPIMLSYSFLQSRTVKIIDSLDEFSLKLINLIFSKKRERNVS
ncbi:MAG: MotA/TolQ/ExbB proton channel family protein [Nitrospirota bacterium]